MFKKGLKGALKDALVSVAKSDVPAEYVKQVIEVDNRLHNRELEARREAAASGKHKHSLSSSRSDTHVTSTRDSYRPVTHVTSAPSSSSQSDTVPMEVDAVRRGPLTQAERERRSKEGLCFYCGKGQHRIADCPNMSPAAKKARKAKFPSSGKA